MKTLEKIVEKKIEGLEKNIVSKMDEIFKN